MRLARLYANENFALAVVEELRNLGHDVLTIQETGKAGQSATDDEVLLAATSDERTVLTFNRKHFIRLHRELQGHAGIIVCSFDPDFVALADRIHASIQSLSSLAGELIRINPP